MTAPVNLVDAIAAETIEKAKTRTATTRIGTVVGVPVSDPATSVWLVPVAPGGSVGDTKGGTIQACFNANYWPLTKDRVALLNEADQWFILYKIAGVNQDAFLFRQTTQQLPFTGTAFAGHPDLYLDLAPSAVYQFECMVSALGTNGTDMSYRFTHPAGSLSWHAHGIQHTATDRLPVYGAAWFDTVSPSAYGWAGTIDNQWCSARFAGVVTTNATGGRMQLQLAQVAAISGQSLWIGPGSFIRAQRVG